MARVDQEIELGSRVCRVIKQSLYPDEKWFDCYRRVGADLTKLKDISRPIHQKMNTIELLILLGHYDHDDIRDNLL